MTVMPDEDADKPAIDPEKTDLYVETADGTTLDELVPPSEQP